MLLHTGQSTLNIELIFKQAIVDLGADRVGHGYHTVDDESVMVLAQRENTHFEVCPLSSYLTSAVTVPWNQHPAKV